LAGEIKRDLCRDGNLRKSCEWVFLKRSGQNGQEFVGLRIIVRKELEIAL